MARINEFLEWLTCPVCGGPLHRSDDGLACPAGHTADVAKQGYANLLGPRGTTHTADQPEMLDARTRILGSGLFDPVSEALRTILGELRVSSTPGPVLDLGTGTGFHLERALEELPERLGLGLDNSKYAARRAARSHPRAGAVVADVWAGIPLVSGSVAVLLDIFAPRNGPEIERVLAPGGTAIVVVAGLDHLGGIPEGLGMITVDPEKSERLGAKLSGLEAASGVERVEWSMALSPDEICDLVAMGPGHGRVDAGTFEARIGELDERTEVTGQVEIYRLVAPAAKRE